MPIQRSWPVGGDQVGDVVLDLAVALQRRQEAAVGDVRGPASKSKKQRPMQILGRRPKMSMAALLR